MQQPFSHTDDLLMQAPIAMAVLSGNGFVIEKTNNAFLKLTGQSAIDIIGKPWPEALPGLKNEGFAALVQAAINPEKNLLDKNFEISFVHPEKGEEVYTELTCRLISTIEGNASIIVAATDVTDLIKSRQAVQESEKAFRKIILDSPVAMGILQGAEMHIQIANTELLQLWQRTEAEVSGRRLLDVFPELAQQNFLALLSEVFTTGVSCRQEDSLVYIETTRGLREYYLDYMFAPVHAQDDTITGVVMTIHDVTARVTERRKLAEKEDHFRTMADNVPAMLFVSGADGGVTYNNSQWYEYTGQLPEEATGYGWLSVVHSDDQARVETTLQKAIRQQLPFKAEFRLRSQFGHYRWFVEAGAPRYGTNGLLEGYTGTVTDIHERKVAEEKLKETEASIRIAAEGNGIATWDIDLKSTKMLYSPRLNELFGYPKSAAFSRADLREKIHPDDLRDFVNPALELALATGNFSYEARVYWPDDSLHWLRAEGRIIFSDTGAAQRMMGTMTDITLQRSSRAALEENELLFKTIAGAAPVGLWLTNTAGRCIFVNDTWVNWSGISFEENINTGWFHCVLDEDAVAVRETFRSVVPERRYFNSEFRIKRPDGKVRWCYSEGYPYFDIHGSYAGYSGSVSDITDRKNTEEELEQRVQARTEELQRANVKLELTNHELEQYAYVASHDLQEPLRKIRTYSDLLYSRLQSSIPTASLETLQKVMTSAERMSNLIKDLLHFSRLSNIEQAFENVVLDDVLSNVKNDFELTIEQKNAVLDIAPLPEVYASPLQMNQLFYNLINNALKFSKPGVPPRIDIKASIASGAFLAAHNLDVQQVYHLLTISDNGIGFGQQYASQIFEVFKRLHSKADYPGSGIGLALCRKIVLNHQGAIYAVAEDGAGAIFNILLPKI